MGWRPTHIASSSATRLLPSHDMEVAPDLAARCLLTEDELRLEEGMVEQDERLLLVADLLLSHAEAGLTPTDLLALAGTCKQLWRGISRNTLWPLLLGFVLVDVPENFSPLKLYRLMRAEQENPHWERKLLTAAVEETRTSNSKTRLYVSLTTLDSRSLWVSLLTKLLHLPTFPTAAQAAQLVGTVKVLRTEHSFSPLLLLELAEGIENINGTLQVVLANELRLQFPAASAAHIARLLPTVPAALQLYALCHGQPVDQLKDEKWALKRVSLPMRARKAIVLALARVPAWLQLSDLFKTPGLAKTAMKSIHVGQLVRKLLAKHEEDKELAAGLARAFLLQACLRGAKYPAEPEWAEWRRLVVQPLRQVVSSPLFDVAPEWLADEWQAEMVGKRLPRPAKRTVEAVLAQEGNCRATWAKLFEGGLVTPGQVLANLRSLLLLAVDVQTVRHQLERAFDDIPLLSFAKVQQLVAAQFTDALVGDLVTQLAEAPEGQEEAKCVMHAWAFKDKRGARHVAAPVYTVARAFGPSTVAAYKELLAALVDKKLGQVPGQEQRATTTAVIQCTAELQNLLRVGVPPAVPPYTRATLWRGERICLQELAREGEALDKLRMGMSWCAAQGQSGDVDLDLTTILFDANYAFVDHCSFQKLIITGAVHSGDWTSAPYPKGARETIEIDLPALLKAYPTAKFFGVVVYSYSRQPFDTLHDASVFVGNPQLPGNGPGQIDVITASRLCAPSRTELAGYLEFDRQRDLTYFTCVDGALNSVGNTSTDSHGVIGSLVRTANFTASELPQPSLSYAQVAALYAAAIADHVILVQDGEQVALQAAEGEDRESFYARIVQAVAAGVHAVTPATTLPVTRSDTGRLVVFGGDSTDPLALAQENSSYASASGALVLANLRSPLTESSVKDFGRNCSLKLVAGVDCLSLLQEGEAAA